jgi:hypothetical protein
MSTGNTITITIEQPERCVYEYSTAVVSCRDCWKRFTCKNWRNQTLPHDSYGYNHNK